MRLRTRQLACLLLLLTSFGAAGAATARVRITHTQIQALLARGAEITVGNSAPLTPEPQNPGDRSATALPSATSNIFRIIPAVHPPAAQAVAMHTATSFARA